MKSDIASKREKKMGNQKINLNLKSFVQSSMGISTKDVRAVSRAKRVLDY